MRLNISTYHEYFNSSLLEITIPSYPWDLPSQPIMRSTISNYHEIHISRSDHTMQIQANLVHHVFIHFRLLGQPRIYLCERTCSPTLFMSKCKIQRKHHHNPFIMTSPQIPTINDIQALQSITLPNSSLSMFNHKLNH